MKPGDTVTCSSCRAQARVWSTGAQHVDGWPVLVTWDTPAGERTMVEDTGAKARPQLTCRACGSSDPRAVVVHDRQADGTFGAAASASPASPPPEAPPRAAPATGQLGLFG